MKKYFAPEAEVYSYKLEEEILGASTGEYGGDEIIENEGNDPLGSEVQEPPKRVALFLFIFQLHNSTNRRVNIESLY